MIEIRYSIKRGVVSEMADISGSWKDFENLRQILLNFLESRLEEYFVDVNESANLEGWDFILKRLKISQIGKSVKVSVIDNKILQITGSKDNLNIFASWLMFDETDASGYHEHYEYFEGNEHINSKSIPLIIGIK